VNKLKFYMSEDILCMKTIILLSRRVKRLSEKKGNYYSEIQRMTKKSVKSEEPLVKISEASKTERRKIVKRKRQIPAEGNYQKGRMATLKNCSYEILY